MTKSSLIGTTLEGRFQITALLGEGAMGKVYLAEHPVLGRQYAVKVLKESAAQNKNLAERFRREAKIASRLDHQNIVVITDFGTMENGQLYLIMEYIAGESLRAVLDAQPGRLPLMRALELLRQLCDAVGAAHQKNIIHRDIKPDNILLGKNRTGGDLVKILDFGLAKIVEGTDMPKLTQQGDIFGSPYYMSPEQCIGEPSDHRADIYALGIVGFELLTGNVPFSGKTVVMLIKAHTTDPPPRPSSMLAPGDDPLPAAIEEHILCCLEKNKDKRPQTALELKVLIEEYQAKHREMSEAAGGLRPPENITAVVHDAQPAFFGGAAPQPARPTRAPAQQPGQVPGAPPPPPSPMSAPASPDAPSLLGGEADAETRKRWYWNRVCKIAMDLAQRLKRHRFSTAELLKVFDKASSLEEKELLLQTDIALLTSEIQDLDEEMRGPIMRLRHAIVDLRVERDSLHEATEPNFLGMADLEFQIHKLELRLAETYSETEGKQKSFAATLEGMRNNLAALQNELTDLERRLISHLQAAKPMNPPPGIAAKYSELEETLAKMLSV
ncbi:MAG: protein kinase [bacterium]